MTRLKSLTHFPFLFFGLTAITGVWMRFFIISGKEFIPYNHLLHGHSHMAILGWTFLAVFILFINMNWDEIIYKGQAITIVFSTVFVTIIMFFAFLYEGYALYSIIFSTLHIGIEYWVIMFIFISLKTISTIPKIAQHFIKGSLFMLFISTLGPFSLGAIAAQGLRDSVLFDIAIYFYLHFQYNGWLYLFLIGMFIALLKKKGITLRTSFLQTSFWIYIISLFPGFFLSILWVDVGFIGIVFAVVGAIGQLLGVIIICIALFQVRSQFQQIFSRRMNRTYCFIFALLMSKSVMELGLLHLPFALLVYDSRSVVIGYLHLMFLGFISIFILTLFQNMQLLQESSTWVQKGMSIFLAGFLLNEFVLFLSGYLTWTIGKTVWFHHELLFVASILLLCSIGILWTSFVKNSRTA